MTSDVHIEDEASVMEYIAAYNVLRGHAYSPKKSREVIADIMQKVSQQ